MTVNDLVEKLKSVKAKDTEVLFRTSTGETLEIGGMYYGLNTDGVVAHPQVGQDPNCIIVQVAPVKQA